MPCDTWGILKRDAWDVCYRTLMCLVWAACPAFKQKRRNTRSWQCFESLKHKHNPMLMFQWLKTLWTHEHLYQHSMWSFISNAANLQPGWVTFCIGKPYIKQRNKGREPLKLGKKHTKYQCNKNKALQLQINMKFEHIPVFLWSQ